MTSNKYPRVAIVTTLPMGTGTAAGLAVRSFFLDWDRTQLTHIFAPFLSSGHPDFDVCHDYRRLYWNGRVAKVESLKPGALQNPPKRLRRWVARLASLRFLQRLGIPIRSLWLSLPRYTRGLQCELLLIRPDVVYAWPSSMHLAKSVCIACENLDIPLFIHIVDDYVRGFLKPGSSLTRTQKLAEHWLQRVVNYATGHAAISPHMAKEYTNRYGGEWTWFTTLADADAYDPTPRSVGSSEAFRLVFAGNLNFTRWRTLRLLGLALRQLYDEGLHAKLVVYGSPAHLEWYQSELNIPQVIDLREWVSVEQLPHVFRDADILVHAESSSDQEIAETIKWSLSTKISQYMMAGRCILAIGPPSLASIKFVKENDAGVVIETEELQAMTDRLRMALKDRDLLIRLGQNGRKRAIEVFEGKTQRERFLLLLNETIRKHHRRKTTEYMGI